MSRVFKKHAGEPLLIGSVKTNLGHSEAASGISSIIKVVLALEKGEIPPTIGVRNINPKIKTDDWGVRIVTDVTPWPQDRQGHGKRVRRAGVNSFGYGGANAHAILEAAETHVPEGYMRRSKVAAADDLSSRTKTIMLPFSASNLAALEKRVSDLRRLDLANTSITDLAHTLAAKRSRLSTRGYVLTDQDMLDKIAPEDLRTCQEGKAYTKLPLAFVFTGQGAQWPEMGRELMDEFDAFRQAIEEMDDTLQRLPHPPAWTLKGKSCEQR